MFRNALEPWHLVLIVSVLIMLFGAKKLPDLARGVGKSMRILKAETQALHEDDEDGPSSTPAESPAIEQKRAESSAPTEATTAQATGRQDGFRDGT